jgi:diguanylate cyclase (GGDEF)-like protein
LDAGADDCVPELTPQTIQSILRVKKRIKDLWMESETDALTGCYTRKFLDSYMRSLDQEPYFLFMCDLDYFKQVNDTYGHDAGDAVLKAFGRHLRKNLRGTDVCIRYGGEEFLAILPAATPEDAEKVALKICVSWQGQSIETDADTVSIGVSGSSPESIKNADATLAVLKMASIVLVPTDGSPVAAEVAKQQIEELHRLNCSPRFIEVLLATPG